MFALVGVLPFWCTLFKTIRLVAGEKDQGFLFGLYYMCNGLTGAIANAVGLKLAGMADSVDKKFFIAVVVYGFATALGALARQEAVDHHSWSRVVTRALELAGVDSA